MLQSLDDVGSGQKFYDQQNAEEDLSVLTSHLKGYDSIILEGFPLIIVCDDSGLTGYSPPILLTPLNKGSM